MAMPIPLTPDRPSGDRSNLSGRRSSSQPVHGKFKLAAVPYEQEVDLSNDLPNLDCQNTQACSIKMVGFWVMPEQLAAGLTKDSNCRNWLNYAGFAD
jgi:hypothetical protein